MFDIYDVLQVDNLPIIKKHGNEVEFQCPECGDLRGKCSYNVAKRACNCFVCGFHGTALTIHQEMTGISDPKEAAKDLYARMGRPEIQMKPRFDSQIIPEKKQAQLAPKKYISDVYWAMLKLLKLNPEHKADLLRRGLTEDQIRQFHFRSMPEDTREMSRKLTEQGYTLEGVPGFYETRYGHWYLVHPCSGYLCPVFDEHIITGFQIRVDHPEGGCKYIWLSSASKYNGCSCGAQATRLPGRTGMVIVTEGILKATVTWSLLKGQASVIGVPGVASLKNLPMHLVEYTRTASVIIEAYDMDKRPTVSEMSDHDREKQERIEKDRQRLEQMIRDYGYGYYSLAWDKDDDGRWKGNIKGIDDYLLSLSEERREAAIKQLLEISNSVEKKASA